MTREQWIAWLLADGARMAAEERLQIMNHEALMDAFSTPARYQVIRVLLAAEKPLTVPEIFQRTTRLQHIGIGKVIRALSRAHLISTIYALRGRDSYYVHEDDRPRLESLLAEQESAVAQ